MKIFVATLLASLFGIMSYGQLPIGDRVRVRAEQKINERINRKIDEAIDKVLDQAEENAKKEREARRETQPEGQPNEAGAGVLSGLFTVANMQEKYVFDGRVKMQITTLNSNGKVKDQSQHLMWYPLEGPFQAMSSADSKEAVAVLDFGNKSMISLNITDKTGVAIPMQGILEAIMKAGQEAAVEESPAEPTDFSFSKTGKTKTIAGYLCEEYLAKDSETQTSIWFTQSLPYAPYAFLQVFATSGASYGKLPAGAKGYVMQWVSRDIKSGEVTEMEVKEVKREHTVFDMGDYQISSLGGAIRR